MKSEIYHCPWCGSTDCGRIQWVGGYSFEYWTCLDCDHTMCVSFDVANNSRKAKKEQENVNNIA